MRADQLGAALRLLPPEHVPGAVEMLQARPGDPGKGTDTEAAALLTPAPRKQRPEPRSSDLDDATV